MHSFCGECIHHCIRVEGNSAKCPHCRAPIPSKRSLRVNRLVGDFISAVKHLQKPAPSSPVTNTPEPVPCSSQQSELILFSQVDDQPSTVAQLKASVHVPVEDLVPDLEKFLNDQFEKALKPKLCKVKTRKFRPQCKNNLRKFPNSDLIQVSLSSPVYPKISKKHVRRSKAILAEPILIESRFCVSHFFFGQQYKASGTFVPPAT